MASKKDLEELKKTQYHQRQSDHLDRESETQENDLPHKNTFPEAGALPNHLKQLLGELEASRKREEQLLEEREAGRKREEQLLEELQNIKSQQIKGKMSVIRRSETPLSDGRLPAARRLF